MKKSILIGAVALLSVATLAFASGDCSKNYKDKGYYKSNMSSKCDYKKSGDYHKRYSDKCGKYSKYGKYSHSKRGYSHDKMFMKMFAALNLSKEQRASIRDIMMAGKKSYKSDIKRAPFSQYFENGNFNKAKFVKDAEKRSAAMIEKRAEKMSKIFAVLNKKQKEEFVTLLKAKEIMMNARKNSWKSKKHSMR